METDFYTNISKLLYALAAIDGNINPGEFFTFKNSIEKDWAKIASAKQINSVLDTFAKLKSNNAQPEKCFDEFVTYKNLNEELFTETIKTTLLKTAGLIASSFSSKNKSELIMLARLDILFKQ